jgi:diamine N-acetyltransferase
MICLEPIGPDNWREELAVREDQKGFVSDPNRILARAYAHRRQRSQAKLILEDETPVGMVMYFDWPEAGQYVFSQLFIDQRYQGRGLGEQAARLTLDELRADGRFEKVCLCYVEGDDPARRLYEKLGFRPTGEVDGDEVIMALDRL